MHCYPDSRPGGWARRMTLCVCPVSVSLHGLPIAKDFTHFHKQMSPQVQGWGNISSQIDDCSLVRNLPHCLQFSILLWLPTYLSMFTGQAILIRGILDLPDLPALSANATYKEQRDAHCRKPTSGTWWELWSILKLLEKRQDSNFRASMTQFMTLVVL